MKYSRKELTKNKLNKTKRMINNPVIIKEIIKAIFPVLLVFISI